MTNENLMQDIEVEVEGKTIGAVYYDRSVGYCFVCDDDGHEEQGFNRADKAEQALLDYYYG